MFSPRGSGWSLHVAVFPLLPDGRAAVDSPSEAVSCGQDPRVTDQGTSTVVDIIELETDLPGPVACVG